MADPKRLPIFRVRRNFLDDHGAEKVAVSILGTGLTAQSTQDGLRFRRHDVYLDVNLRTGALWLAADELWRPQLRTDTQSEVGLSVVARPFRPLSISLPPLPQSGGGVDITVEEAWTSGTHVALWRNETRTDYADIDVTKSYTLTIQLPSPWREALPIIGYGAKCGMVFNLFGQPIGLNSSWAGTDGVERDAPVIPESESDKAFREMLPNVGDLRFESSLAYRVVEPNPDTAYLCPCRVYRAEGTISKKRMHLGSRVLPATRFEARPPNVRPRAKARKRRFRTKAGKVNWPPDKPDKRFLMSWLSETGALLQFGQGVRDRVLKELNNEGWVCRDYADNNAYEADWHANVETGAGAADLAYYLGHADAESLQLSSPNDTRLESTECRFGVPRLKWIIVDACGPLQDTTTCMTNSVLDRWRKAFGGLHSLLGFATDQTQNSDQGPEAIKLALDPTAPLPLAGAWFRAVVTYQTNRCYMCNTGIPYVAGLFAVKGTETTQDDYLLGNQTPPLAGVTSNPDLLPVWVPIA